MDDIFESNNNYRKLYECFIELAETDTQKNAIEQIMKNGEYNGFKLNSELSNQAYNKAVEIKRRITFSEMALHDEELFFHLANNGLNIFHGTRIDALETILNKGLLSSYELSKNEMQLKTGEEFAMNKIYGFSPPKRAFVSLTDDFDTAATNYAGFPYDESIEFSIENFGKDITTREPLLICFNGTEIEQKYGKSLIRAKGDFPEIPINSSISPSDIKCLITTYDKLEYVKSIASQYGIDVLGYDNNHKFEKRRGYEKEGKFYFLRGGRKLEIDIDEQEFEKVKEKLKEYKNVSQMDRVQSEKKEQLTKDMDKESLELKELLEFMDAHKAKNNDENSIEIESDKFKDMENESLQEKPIVSQDEEAKLTFSQKIARFLEKHETLMNIPFAKNFVNKQLNILPPAIQQEEINNSSSTNNKRIEFANELSNNGEFRNIKPLQHSQEKQNIQEIKKKIFEENQR